MKCGARVALGVAGGYFLGRTKKMKLALMLGGMAAGGQAGGPGQILAQGSKLLGQSPELSRLADEVRGRLLEAGKSAGMAVAARQVEALTDRVGKRVESLGGVGSTVGKTVGGRRSRKKPEPEFEENEEYPEDDAAPGNGAASTAGADEEREGPADEDRPVAEEDDRDLKQAAPARRPARDTGRSTSARRGGSSAAATAAMKRGGSTGRASGARSATRSTRTRRGDSDD